MDRIFRDNEGNNHLPIEVVFPIIRYDGNRTNFVGTGFFVHPAGGFITARHVLPNNRQEQGNYYAVQTIDGTNHIIRQIQIFFPHPSADIGIGMLRGRLMEDGRESLRVPLTISLNEPEIGEIVRTFAFPRTVIETRETEVILDVRGNWQEGEIVDFLENRPMFNSPCFQTSISVEGGASGGPVLSNGLVIGVNSTGFDLEPGADPISFITPISQVFDLEVHDSDGEAFTVRQLMEEGYIASLRR